MRQPTIVPSALALTLALGFGFGFGLVACGDSAADDDRTDADLPNAKRDAGDVNDRDAMPSDAALADAGDAATATTNPISLQTYCQAVADWYYPFLQGCYGKEPYPDADAPMYKQDWQERCVRAQVAVDGERVAFDGEVAARCAEALDGIECFESAERLPACQGMFVGKVPTGESCYPDEQRFFAIVGSTCDEGLCLGNACPSRCEAYPALDALCIEGLCGPGHYCDGERCRELKGEDAVCDGNACDVGLTCVELAAGPRCKQLVAEGAACGPDTVCGAPDVCVAGTCKRHVALGEPCRRVFNCPAGASCGTLAGATEPTCFMPGGAATACLTDAHCNTPAVYCNGVGGEAGTCEAPPAAGQLCDSMERCAEGAWCQITSLDPEGRCQPLGAMGADCHQYDATPDPRGCQANLYCTTVGTCQPAGNLGEPCAPFVAESCVGDLHCARASGTCQPAAVQGAQCNPLWANTCEAGLGCHCGFADWNACGSTAPESTPTDTCQPLRANGDACKRTAECTSNNCEPDPSFTSATCVDVTPAPPCLGPT